MAAAQYVSAFALCPFYRLQSNTWVQCEGIEDGSTVKLAFKATQHAQEYIRQFCNGDWDACRIARMLNQKYEDGAG